MPPTMRFSPRGGGSVKPSSNGARLDGTSMNVGNKIGARPTTHKGAFASKNESGSAMTALLYGGSGDAPQPENPMRPTSFANAAGADSGYRSQPFGAQDPNHMGQMGGSGTGGRKISPNKQKNESGNAVKFALGTENLAWGGPQAVDCDDSADDDEVEYPLPGCRATCDGCGVIVTRFYHCTVCDDPDLYDLCPKCCTAIYLPPEKRPASLIVPQIHHPTHNLETHEMELIEAPA